MNSSENLKDTDTKQIPHGKVKETAIVPRNMDEVRALLSGRDSRFREPITQGEERAYKKVWRRRGKGLTKPFKTKAEKKATRKESKKGKKANRK